MTSNAMLARLTDASATAAFNRWLGIDVAEVEEGRVVLRLPWRDEFGQYAGFMHAGIVGALIDTACGFAASTVAGGVLASHYAVNCVAPAVGERFEVIGLVVKAGRKQVFARAELFAEAESKRRLVATGDAILVPTGQG